MDRVHPALLEAAVCPEDRGMLSQQAGIVRCGVCSREFTTDEEVLILLPDRLAHLRHSPPEPHTRSDDHDVRWIEDEMEWWNPWHERNELLPAHPRSGLRGRSRERNLLRHVRDRVGQHPLVIEMGAGTSRTVAGLWPPSEGGLQYIATDVSLSALRAGRRILGPQATSVQCDAVGWPFREGIADVVLVLGVLHHLSDWHAALERAYRTVRPGGFLLLHEAVTKPRLFARFRDHGLNDDWTSPHEGNVPAGILRSELERHGQLLRWRGEESPLRFALVRYMIHRKNRHDLLESSPALTITFNALDQLFGKGMGRLSPSFGFTEITAVWQRPGASQALAADPPA